MLGLTLFLHCAATTRQLDNYTTRGTVKEGKDGSGGRLSRGHRLMKKSC